MFCQDMFRLGECQKNIIFEIPISRKEKRQRTAFTTEQLDYLEREYKTCPYSEHARLSKIANVIKKPEKVVKVWFQNRRSRERKIKRNKKILDDKNKLDVTTANKSRLTPLYPTQFNHKTNLYPMQVRGKADLMRTNEINPNKGQNIGTEKCARRTLNNFNINNNMHLNNNNVNKTNNNTNNNPIYQICQGLSHSKFKSNSNKVPYHNIKGSKTIMNTKIIKNVANTDSNIKIANTKSKNITHETKPDIIPINHSRHSLSYTCNNKGNNSGSNLVSKANHGFLPNYEKLNILDEKNNRHYLSQDVNNIHSNKINTKLQKKSTCNCESSSEYKQKQSDYQIPYVIIIPCFK